MAATKVRAAVRQGKVGARELRRDRTHLGFVLFWWGWDGVEESGAVRGDPLRLAAQPDVVPLAREYNVHRRTVRQAIASPVLPDRKVSVPGGPVREAVTGWIDEMLVEDLGAPAKTGSPRRAAARPSAHERGGARRLNRQSPERNLPSPRMALIVRD
jgi:hypothetical protein